MAKLRGREPESAVGRGSVRLSVGERCVEMKQDNRETGYSKVSRRGAGKYGLWCGIGDGDHSCNVKESL